MARTIKEQVLEVFTEAPDLYFSIPEVIEKTGLTYDQVRQSLFQLKLTGQITQVHRGVYVLNTEDDNLPQFVYAGKIEDKIAVRDAKTGQIFILHELKL